MILPSSRSLIVGAAGQVGHQLTLQLGSQALPTTRAESDANRVDLVQLAHTPSLAASVIAQFEASSPLEAIYCVGGATDVERCESDPAWAMETNTHGPVALARACRHLPFIYFSTEYVFDGRSGPYDELAPTNALSVYGRSKLEAEQQILDLHPNSLILRTTVVFGPDVQQKNFLYGVKRRLGGGESIKVPSDQISTPTYNIDLARSTIKLVQGGHTGIFHVCGPEVISRVEFARIAAETLGLDADLIVPTTTEALKQKAPRPLRAGLLSHKANQVLGETCVRTTKDAVAEWAAGLS